MKLQQIPFLLLATFSSAAPSGLYSSHDPPTVTIESGVIQGISTIVPGAPYSVNKYLGVPFAAPPVRWEPPQSPKTWQSPFEAAEYGPACIQQFSYPASSRAATIQWFNTPPPPAGESEDCLNLNIYVPVSHGKSGYKPKVGKAVMVWFYGGSLKFGANSLASYDGSFLAAFQDVIIVTVNYRTNVFGFPGSPEISPRGNNLGHFLDQRFALTWVQRNIAALGGDPGKVTIFGESAGSRSVDILVTSFATDAPFRAAIEQSGQGTYSTLAPDPYAAWNTLANASGCIDAASSLACLRELPATEIKNTIEQLALNFDMVIDNYTVMANRSAARDAGNIAKVPILVGTNADEGTVFVYGLTNLTKFLDDTFPRASQSFKDLVASSYPIGSPGIANSSQQISKISTEFRFQCAPAKLIRKTREIGVPAWRYFFNASFDHLSLFPGDGVFHSSEIPLIFGTYQLEEGYTGFEQSLSNFFQSTWAGFAKDPYSGPGWSMAPTLGIIGSEGVLLSEAPSSSIDQRCALYDPLYR